MIKKFPLFLTLAVFGLILAKAQACQVPVYRYALERWPAYPFKITVFHRGELTADQQKALDMLPENRLQSTHPLNAIARKVDVNGSLDEITTEIWKTQGNPELPWVVAQFPPADRMGVPAWCGKLTLENIKLLADSPARREVARRILGGDTAVWLLVESGNPKAAQATSKMVANQLKQLETILKLPVQDTSAPPAYPTSSIPLKIGFSVLRIRADDPAEKLFLEILRQSSRNPLAADTNVIAYPIFGRGRCFGALAGSDLSREGIEQACSFLVGPCSCIIKSQNPGVDLLMSVKWDDLISGKVAVDEELPPLRGLMPMAVTVSATPAAQPIPSTNGRCPVVLAPAVLEKGNLMRNVLSALGGGVVLVLGFAFFVWRKRR